MKEIVKVNSINDTVLRINNFIFIECSFEEIQFTNIKNCIFLNCKFYKCNFSNFKNCKFNNGTIISGTLLKLTSTLFNNIDFIENTLYDSNIKIFESLSENLHIHNSKIDSSKNKFNSVTLYKNSEINSIKDNFINHNLSLKDNEEIFCTYINSNFLNSKISKDSVLINCTDDNNKFLNSTGDDIWKF